MTAHAPLRRAEQQALSAAFPTEDQDVVPPRARLADERRTPMDETLAKEPEARARFGKGIDPAALDFGDCFAYAVARRTGAAMPYESDDFALADMGDATFS